MAQQQHQGGSDIRTYCKAACRLQAGAQRHVCSCICRSRMEIACLLLCAVDDGLCKAWLLLLLLMQEKETAAGTAATAYATVSACLNAAMTTDRQDLLHVSLLAPQIPLCCNRQQNNRAAAAAAETGGEEVDCDLIMFKWSRQLTPGCMSMLLLTPSNSLTAAVPVLPVSGIASGLSFTNLQKAMRKTTPRVHTYSGDLLTAKLTVLPAACQSVECDLFDVSCAEAAVAKYNASGA